MHQLLEDIFVTKTFLNRNNQVIEIHSETSKKQCEFLQKIIRDNHFKKSLEIGFAYGMSTLAIIEEIKKNDGRHLVIDKYQVDGWGGNGLDLIEQAGYLNDLEFSDELCYKILPKFLEEGRRFDFAYIDSTKEFDWLLVDFFYIDKILEINGIIIFDDVLFPGIRKLLRYISQFPNYKVYAQFPGNARMATSKKFAEVLRFIPKSKHLIKEELLKSDFDLGINAHCVALIKTGNDKRDWDWHVPF